MSGLRVAIFAESYLPYLSGVTVSTEALARGLGALGHDVLLVAPRPAVRAVVPSAGSPGPEPAYAWLPSYQGAPPAPPGYRMPLPVPSAALRAARDFAPDVVHAQSPFVSGLMARRLARGLDVPLVFTHHTRFADYRHYLGPLARPGARAVEAYLRAFWAGCSAVIAPGEDLAREIGRELGGRRRPLVRAIPTGVDVEAIRRLAPVDPRPLHDWPPESVVMVSVGRLAAEKSVDLLVEAFALAAGEEAGLRLLLVGGGPAEVPLRDRAASAGLAGRLALAGRRSRMEALALARAADLFAIVSRTETQGLVVAEALAAGLPVLGVDAPGVRDAVRPGREGVLVPAEPREDLVQRLAREMVGLAADTDRRRALAANAVAAAQRFDVRVRVGEVLALYEEVLAAHARRA